MSPRVEKTNPFNKNYFFPKFIPGAVTHNQRFCNQRGGGKEIIKSIFSRNISVEKIYEVLFKSDACLTLRLGSFFSVYRNIVLCSNAMFST